MSSSITTCSKRVALLLAASLASLTCAAPQTGDSAVPGRAADFALRDTEGRMVRLSDHLGKVVLLNFWATWCTPCAAELPHLQRLYETYEDQGLVILAISMDGPETVANVIPHARRYGLTFPVLLDEETRVVGMYNPKRAAPFNVLIDRDGVVVEAREGYSAGDEIAMEEDVQALLGDRNQPR